MDKNEYENPMGGKKFPKIHSSETRNHKGEVSVLNYYRNRKGELRIGVPFTTGLIAILLNLALIFGPIALVVYLIG